MWRWSGAASYEDHTAVDLMADVIASLPTPGRPSAE